MKYRIQGAQDHGSPLHYRQLQDKAERTSLGDSTPTPNGRRRGDVGRGWEEKNAPAHWRPSALRRCQRGEIPARAPQRTPWTSEFQRLGAGIDAVAGAPSGLPSGLDAPAAPVKTRGRVPSLAIFAGAAFRKSVAGQRPISASCRGSFLNARIPFCFIVSRLFCLQQLSRYPNITRNQLQNIAFPSSHRVR